MKKIIIITLACIMASCIIDVNGNGNGNEFSFSKEYSVTSPVSLNVSTTGGGINVSGYDKDIIEVKFVVREHNKLLKITLDELDQYAEYEINAGKQSLDIKIKKIKENNVSIGFIIKTPVTTSCNLNTGGGGIDAANLNGSFACNTGGGGIGLKQITGPVNCNTGGGGIDMFDIKGDINANTGGGGVDLSNIEGKTEINTGGGGIDINNLKPYVSANTGGGGINIRNTQGTINVNTGGGGIDLSNISGSIEASTGGGGIDAKIFSLKEKMRLSTGGGDISVEMPSGGYNLELKADKINTRLTGFDGINKTDYISGAMNGGGIPVEIEAQSGAINLNFR
jgi:archaellin